MNYYPILVGRNQLEKRIHGKNYRLIGCDEISAVEINDVTKKIMNFCDGDNSIEDIVKKLSNIYYKTDINIIRTDLMTILERLWLSRQLVWKEKNNPFSKKYQFEENGVKYKMIMEEELGIYHRKLKGKLVINAMFNNTILFDEVASKSLNLVGVKKCFVKEVNDEISDYIELYFGDPYFYGINILSFYSSPKNLRPFLNKIYQYFLEKTDVFETAPRNYLFYADECDLSSLEWLSTENIKLRNELKIDSNLILFNI